MQITYLYKSEANSLSDILKKIMTMMMMFKTLASQEI